MTNSQNLLKKFFGYDNFRPGQEEIINNIDTILTFSIAYALVKFSEDFGLDLADCIIKD